MDTRIKAEDSLGTTKLYRAYTQRNVPTAVVLEYAICHKRIARTGHGFISVEGCVEHGFRKVRNIRSLTAYAPFMSTQLPGSWAVILLSSLLLAPAESAWNLSDWLSAENLLSVRKTIL